MERCLRLLGRCLLPARAVPTGRPTRALEDPTLSERAEQRTRGRALSGLRQDKQRGSMSIKIFYGYRFPKTRLAEFTTVFREQHYQHVLNYARSLCAKSRFKADDTGANTWDQRVSRVVKMASDAAAKPERMVLADLECGWRVWVPPRSRFCYTAPWGENPVAGDQLKMPEWLEEYGYWDNTDQPESVTAREWNTRKRAWRCYTEPGGENHCLRLSVIDLRDGVGSYHRAALYIDLMNLGEPSVIEVLGSVAE